jgi:MptA/FolE2 family GTP cyclohydrolase
VLEFPYFLERSTPISGLRSVNDYEGRLVAEVNGPRSQLEVGVRVPVASLCPCSKEISDYGAHNQRGYVDLDVRCSSEHPVWLQDLVEVAEGCGSAPIYTLLKRVDERHVTMEAYDNPAFVEDIARDAALALRGDGRVEAFTVRVANQESIHNHEAVARIRWERP